MNKLFAAAVVALALPTLPAAAQNSSMSHNQNQGQTTQSSQSSQSSPISSPSRDMIRQVQQALDQKGFNPGPTDGRMGSRTKQALESFQKKQNLQSSGQLDQQTLAALGVSGNQGRNGSNSTVGQGSGNQNPGNNQSNPNPSPNGQTKSH